MARPRKLSTEKMIQIVNDFYESCGDAGRLKCSFLEEYAVSCGFNVKAYDFRRNAEVRRRIGELMDLSLLPMEKGSMAYKSLDVDALLGRTHSRESLKISLIELDGTWRRIYDRAVSLSKENETLAETIRRQAAEIELHICNGSNLGKEIAKLKNENKTILLENRYLKKMIRAYLYPAAANEILKDENVLEQTDTKVTAAAVEALTETALPFPFSKTVAADRAALSREESLLSRMREQISGENNGE